MSTKGTKQTEWRTWVLVALAAAVTAWSAFLWLELAQARAAGEDPFCAFGDPGACGELWDAPFASAVHRRSGVPVAGWGLVWGLAALALPLASRGGRRPAAAAAVRWLAIGGLAALAALLVASAAEGLFCSSCSVVYVLTFLYGLAALTVGRPPGPSRAAGLGTALAALGVVYGLMIVPGLRTPRSSGDDTLEALDAAARVEKEGGSATRATEPTPQDQGLPPRFSAGPGTGDDLRDQQLQALVGSLTPPLRQALSESLYAYEQAPALPEAEPRALHGPPGAPVRIVEFTDTLCSHCAALHEGLEALRQRAPEGSFSVDSRHYPLDGNCNADLPVRGPETVRCLAARARICLEDHPESGAFTSDLYRRQQGLTPEQVFAVAEPLMARPQLEACVASAETAAALARDVELAARYDPRGTPLVIVNGREASAFLPLLYALVLTGGNSLHPAFAALPAPRPPAGE